MLLAVLGLLFAAASNAQDDRVVVQFPMWDWDITIRPITATGLGDPVEIPLWGEAAIAFDLSQVEPDLGTPDDPRPLPEGQRASIPTELVELSLRSVDPVVLPGLGVLGRVEVRLDEEDMTGRGRINVSAEKGFLVGDSFFDVFVEVELIPEDGNDNGNNNRNEERMVLRTSPETPLRLGMEFTPENRIPANDVFWLPGWSWLINVPAPGFLGPILIDSVSNPWDVVVDVHTFFTPEVECVETVNPHGKTVPPAGKTTLPGPKGGQNEDGFYEFLVEAPDPQLFRLFVSDANGSGPFGPFGSGDKVKITEAPGGKASSKPMGSSNGQAGAIKAHITLTDDAIVTAVDVVGNVVATISCLVPPPPK
jgi:hypothetical protein